MNNIADTWPTDKLSDLYYVDADSLQHAMTMFMQEPFAMLLVMCVQCHVLHRSK